MAEINCISQQLKLRYKVVCIGGIGWHRGIIGRFFGGINEIYIFYHLIFLHFPSYYLVYIIVLIHFTRSSSQPPSFPSLVFATARRMRWRRMQRQHLRPRRDPRSQVGDGAGGRIHGDPAAARSPRARSRHPVCPVYTSEQQWRAASRNERRVPWWLQPDRGRVVEHAAICCSIKRLRLDKVVGRNQARRWTPTQQPPDDSALLRRGHGRRPPRRRT
jgi:hypothetical protein